MQYMNPIRLSRIEFTDTN